MARLQARARAAPTDDVRRTVARARAAGAEAVKAAGALAARPDAADRPGGLFDDSADPAYVADESASHIAAAELMAGDLPAALATLDGVGRAYLRLDALVSVLRDKAKDSGVPAARAIAEADITWLPDDGTRDRLTGYLVAAQVSAKQFEAAEATADRIESAESRAVALLDVAQGLADAGRTETCNGVLQRADDAAERAVDAPRMTPRERVAKLQAQLLQPEVVWAKAAREERPDRRIDLLLAAAEGLMARQNGQPFRD